MRLRKSKFMDTLGDSKLWAEGLFGLPVLDELESPEETFAANVSNVGMAAEKVFEVLAKKFALNADIFAEVFLTHDSLHFESCSGLDRHALVGLTVSELARAIRKRLHHFLGNCKESISFGQFGQWIRVSKRHLLSTAAMG
jgi:hypothetical protein